MNGKRPYMDYCQHRAELKRCTECGGQFLPKSNRGKYCPDCAAKVRRRKEADRQRKSCFKCVTEATDRR